MVNFFKNIFDTFHSIYVVIIGLKSNGDKGVIGRWLDRQFDFAKFVRKDLAEKSTFVPETPHDYLGFSGTVLVALIVIQFFSGLMLLIYYKASPEAAYNSIAAIRNEVPYGMLIQSVHSIDSKLIMLLLFVHMFRIMIVSAHRGPREPQWYIGVMLLVVMLITGFSGYLLPWSQQSFWACVVGTEAVKMLPVVGNGIVRLLRGGDNVGGPTLSRFFMFHVTLFPIAILSLIWIHLKLVWRTGVIGPVGAYAVFDESKCRSCGDCEKVCQFKAVKFTGIGDKKKLPVFNEERSNACRACVDNCPANCISIFANGRAVKIEPLFPHATARRIFAVLVSITIFFALVYFFHGILVEQKEPANPLVTPDRIKPEWYFLASYQVLRWMPNELMGLLFIGAVFIVLFFLPVIDSYGPRDFEHRRTYLKIVGGSIAGFVLLTIVGWLV